MIVIHQNSGPSAQIEPIEALFDRLCHLPLDPAFEEYGNFIDADDGETHFFGGFFGNAATFRISTDERVLIDKLSDAIRNNQETPEYQRVRQAFFAWEQERALLLELWHSTGGKTPAYEEQQRVCGQMNPWFLQDVPQWITSVTAEEPAPAPFAA